MWLVSRSFLKYSLLPNSRQKTFLLKIKILLRENQLIRSNNEVGTLFKVKNFYFTRLAKDSFCIYNI